MTLASSIAIAFRGLVLVQSIKKLLVSIVKLFYWSVQPSENMLSGAGTLVDYQNEL